MVNKQITYKDQNYARISYRKVLNILKANDIKYQNITLYVKTSLSNVNSEWVNGFHEIEIDRYNGFWEYIQIFREIAYYNCNAEMGQKLHYYLETKGVEL